ncbi:30S ribosomal protein S9 [Pelagibacterales bacterium SAG-MED30]|nr:30S ribosomal protein S9 [Pelagibacterales bacterium SAG-MED30]|tara:strand:- start:560 stop:997 length:438 start_codon:yes stop_codon:yes gene_type:complete
MQTNEINLKKNKLKLDFKDSKYATGRRKTSIAKVWVKKGTGKIYVNGKLYNEYFVSENHKMQITRPFELINQSTEYDVRCSVVGGGHTGQAGALVHGISKALVMFDSKLKSTLKNEKLTTRDSRAVERKKPGRRKARRSFQFSKR